jgi:hypothetical protein
MLLRNRLKVFCSYLFLYQLILVVKQLFLKEPVFDSELRVRVLRPVIPFVLQAAVLQAAAASPVWLWTAALQAEVLLALVSRVWLLAVVPRAEVLPVEVRVLQALFQTPLQTDYFED